MVEDVEEVRAELTREPLSDVEVLLSGGIQVVEARTEERVAAQIPEVQEARVGENATERLLLEEGPALDGCVEAA